MFNQWLQLQLPLSLVLLALLCARPWLLQRLGALTLYRLWALVPAVLLVAMLPDLNWLQAPAMQSYQVLAKQLSNTVREVQLMPYLWALGVLAFVVLLLVQQWQLRQVLQQGSAYPAQSGVKALQHEARVGPVLAGLLQPVIILPAGFASRFSPLQQQQMIRHELVHWQRRDPWFNLLGYSLLALSWFNPLCWLALYAFRQDQELSCDALVLAAADTPQRIAYAEALLKNAADSNTFQPGAGWLCSTTYYGAKNQMKQRLTELKQHKPVRQSAVMAAVLLVSTLAFGWQQQLYAAVDKAEPAAPIHRVEPKYPVQAAQQGISGYVQAKFDINPDGSVSNIVITKSVPEATFDKVSLTALAQWRYQASAAGVKGATVQLDYMLDEAPETDMERVQVKPAGASH